MFKLKIPIKDFIFWIVLIFLLFMFSAFDEGYSDMHWHFHWEEIFFILTYFIASCIISYVFIPKLLYRNKILKFTIAVILVFFVVGFIEEKVLEKIFYPNGRGLYTQIIPTFLEIFPSIFIFVGFKFARDAFEKQNKLDKLSRIAAENELQFLNSQINPHFLFNNLNNLYASALENSPKTPKIILQLSSILRYMLYDCKKTSVSLAAEIDNLQQFVNLYQLQIGNDAKIEFKHKGIEEYMQIAPLILIVFVENAFKHSQSSQTEKINISISLQVNNNELEFVCENSYSEVSNIENLNKGIGLKNVMNKLKLVYPKEHFLKIEKDRGMFRVFLKIKLQDD